LSILHQTALSIRSKIRQILPAQPCVLCGQMSHAGHWCPACLASLPYLNGPHCPVCALPNSMGDICGRCLQHPPAFDRTSAAFAYRFPIDRLIQAMKYADQLVLAHALGKQLAQRIAPESLPDCLLPMPLHPLKLRERGYNPALLLSQIVARIHRLRLLPNAVRRVRDTPAQSSLHGRERENNMKDAFAGTMDLRGLRVALVDDVMTTGASLNALARAVREAGAVSVDAWVVARTLPHRPARTDEF